MIERAVTDSAMRSRASELGARLLMGDGIANTVRSECTVTPTGVIVVNYERAGAVISGNV